MAGGSDYTSKPRPVVILQSDRFANTDSITACGITTDETDLPLFRVTVVPTERNGLRSTSRVLVDKITTVRRERVGTLVGVLDDEDLLRIDRAIVLFLGIAATVRRGPRQLPAG